MPCRMDDMPPDTTATDELIKKLKKTGDKATRHLCSVLELLEQRPVTIAELPKDIQKWWAHHRKQDEKRMKREKIEAEIEKLKQELKEID